MFLRVIVTSLIVILALDLPSALSQDVDIPLTASNHQEQCKGVTCASKCCPEGKLINITSCVVPLDLEDLWKPTFYDSKSLTASASPPRNLKFIYGLPSCEAFPLQPYMNEEDVFYLLQDGTLHVPLYGKSYAADRYCIEEFSISLGEREEMALLCFEDPVEEPSKACKVVKQYVIPVLLMTSCVFLVITLAVYLCIPELRGKLHGRCLVSMVSSLLVAYVLMTTVYLASEDMTPVACLFCASLKQMTLMASFFWLNVMCFDIWRSLKSMRPASETSAKSRQRFMLYSLYAWGCPFIIAVITMIIQNLPESYENVVRPNFVNSTQFCWFDGSKSIWLYFYMIVLVLVVANVIFFLMVAYILLKSQNNQRLQRARSQNRDRMWLYGKLFLVMGITWITEVISWKEGTCEAWIFTDIINALQGFTIFLVFVCKKSTRQMVTRRFSKMKSQYSSSSGTSKRSSTFFTNLSKSSSSRNTESSALSSDSQSSTSSPQTHVNSAPRYPLSPMAVIDESVNSVENENYVPREITIGNLCDDPTRPSEVVVSDLNPPPEVDEDRPSIEGEPCPSEDSGVSEGETELLVPTAEDGELQQNSIHGRTSTGTGPNRPSDGVASLESESMVNGLDNSLINGDHRGSDEEDPVPTSSPEESAPLIATDRQGAESAKKELGMKHRENSPLLPRNREGNESDSGHLDT